MAAQNNHSWPIFVEERQGHTIYLTSERWEHALDHPGMDEELLESVLDALRFGRRKQDPYQPDKYKYLYPFPDLPTPYTHIVVVVKFGWQNSPPETNNFVLTAYLIEKF
jgi:hypothetical protein